MLVCLILLSTWVYKTLDNVVYPVIIGYAEAKVDNMIIAAVNKALFGVLNDTVTYSDLITVHKDGDGNIIMLEANTLKINSIANMTARATEVELEQIEDQILEFPLGSLLNSPFLTGYGPIVSVKILSDGSVYCRFKSEFESAGINQTRHKIFIEVCASMEVILPQTNEVIDSIIEIYIAEAVLVGKVPNTYLGFGDSNYIDFVP